MLRMKSLRRLISLTRPTLRLGPNPSPSGPQLSKTSLNTIPTRQHFALYTHNNTIPHHSKSATGKRPQPSSSPSATSSLRRYYASSRRHGSRNGRLSVNSAFWILFGLNATSFCTWWYARLTDNRNLIQLHLANTLTSLAAWDAGRWWTPITSAFAHHDLTHFAFNMLTLHTFCQIISFVPAAAGPHILLLALGSAICASGAWLVQQRTKLSAMPSSRSTSSNTIWGRSNNNNSNNAASSAAAHVYNANALGASGVVMGVGALATCLMPTAPVGLMLIPISFPLWLLTIGYAVADTYFLDSRTSRTAHSAHLGGLVFGAAYYLVFLRHAPMGLWRSLASTFGTR